jgi:hypothetical protein
MIIGLLVLLTCPYYLGSVSRAQRKNFLQGKSIASRSVAQVILTGGDLAGRC